MLRISQILGIPSKPHVCPVRKEWSGNLSPPPKKWCLNHWMYSFRPKLFHLNPIANIPLCTTGPTMLPCHHPVHLSVFYGKSHVPFLKKNCRVQWITVYLLLTQHFGKVGPWFAYDTKLRGCENPPKSQIPNPDGPTGTPTDKTRLSRIEDWHWQQQDSWQIGQFQNKRNSGLLPSWFQVHSICFPNPTQAC